MWGIQPAALLAKSESRTPQLFFEGFGCEYAEERPIS